MSVPARAAVAALAADHGAHIVLADRGKRPCWLDSGPYSWPRRRPSPEVIKAHRGRFGIIPWSVQTTGLDVDHGDPVQLSVFCEPIANLRTRRGRHLYCADNQGRPNGRFELAGCGGDIRGDRGYLVLHYDGADGCSTRCDTGTTGSRAICSSWSGCRLSRRRGSGRRRRPGRPCRPSP